MVVFRDATATSLANPSATFRPVTEVDKERIFEPIGEWLLKFERAVIETGGIATHDNPPSSNLFTEVDEGFRNRGFGSYLLQKPQRLAHETGRSVQRRE